MFQVESFEDLLILQRCLLAGRFAGSSFDPVLLGSPRLAEMHEQVVNSILSLVEGDARSSDAWSAWLKWGNRGVEPDLVVQSVQSARAGFANLEKTNQLAYLKICTVPFITTQLEVEALWTRCLAELELPEGTDT